MIARNCCFHALGRTFRLSAAFQRPGTRQRVEKQHHSALLVVAGLYQGPGDAAGQGPLRPLPPPSMRAGSVQPPSVWCRWLAPARPCSLVTLAVALLQIDGVYVAEVLVVEDRFRGAVSVSAFVVLISTVKVARGFEQVAGTLLKLVARRRT